MKYLIINIFLALTLSLLPIVNADGQQMSMLVNMSAIDGIEVSPDNIFNFQVINNEGSNRNVSINGSIIYKKSGLRFSYKFNTTVYPGMNVFSKENVFNPDWQFSENALRELFFDYKKLPQGTYEYCIEISLERTLSEEKFPDPVGECIYQTVNDIFLINLITPENDAKIYEHNPMLSWMVNYPFASSLSYKLRLAEKKDGQNNENAIVRNNPIYSDKNIFSTSIIYPMTAKPLGINQPYVWTVDAYYKGILLGGAEAWNFTIIEDSFLVERIPKITPYLDISQEKRKDPVFAVGILKLKYDLAEINTDTLYLELKKGDKVIKLNKPYLLARTGDNRFQIDFSGSPRLTHFKTYTLYIKNTKREKFTITFKYINPDLL